MTAQLFTPNSSLLSTSNPNTNNIGIGTSTPSEKLEIAGNIKATSLFLTNYLPNNQIFSSWADRNIKCRLFAAGAITDAPAQSRQFNFFDFPSSNFNINPEVFFTITDRNNKDRYSFNAEASSYSMMRLFDKNEYLYFQIVEDGNDKVELILPKINSFLGIGTTNFVDGQDIYRLAVKGAIRADRVKVYTTWADFVFEKNYNLPTLNEVEKYILKNGHLENIPSAEEVKKNGIDLGEMNKKLLQKLEEMTLYIIQINKELQLLKSKF